MGGGRGREGVVGSTCGDEVPVLTLLALLTIFAKLNVLTILMQLNVFTAPSSHPALVLALFELGQDLASPLHHGQME